jgi:hypothetical protein
MIATQLTATFSECFGIIIIIIIIIKALALVMCGRVCAALRLCSADFAFA